MVDQVARDLGCSSSGIVRRLRSVQAQGSVGIQEPAYDGIV